MKSLKPIQSEEHSVLISSDVKAELDSKIAAIQNGQNNIEQELDNLSGKVDKKNITKDNVTANTVNTNLLVVNTATVEDGNFENINADTIIANSNVDTHLLRADEISADDASIHHIDTDELNVTDAKIESIETDSIKSKKAVIDELDSGKAILSEANLTNANIGNATIGNLGSPNKFETGSFATLDADIEKADIEELSTSKAEIVKARISTLYNQTKQFTDDETDAKQFITIDQPNDGSDGNDDPRYIEVPPITTGWYRMELKKDGETIFSIIYSNAETTPIIHYSKDKDGDLGKFYYDTKTDTLYIETYAAGQLYWSSDAKDAFYTPKTYDVLPIDITDLKVLSFNAVRKHQWVLMGNHTAEYALTVQGLIEADIIKSKQDAFKLIHFYGNDAVELLRFVRDYFSHTLEDTSITDFQQAEVFGYLYHTDEAKDTYTEDENGEYILIGDEYLIPESVEFKPRLLKWEVVYVIDGTPMQMLYDEKPAMYTKTTGYAYRDSDGTKCESLEKVRLYADNTIGLTIDSDYGQDEILVEYDEADTADVTLPFVLGFTIRTKESDLYLNIDQFEGNSEVLSNEDN